MIGFGKLMSNFGILMQNEQAKISVAKQVERVSWECYELNETFAK